MDFEKESRLIRNRWQDEVMRIFCTVLVSIMLVFGVSVSSGLALPIYGDPTTGATEGIGSFTGDFTYEAISETEAILTVQLKNTSTNGGYITGFAFNNPGDRITSVFLENPDTSFHLIGDDSFNNSIKASPFGLFDIGASLDNKNKKNAKLDDLTGTGGDPTAGIAAEASETFTFKLRGSDLKLDPLTEQGFFNELSYNSNKEPSFFAVRFKGFENGGSDKVVSAVPDLVVPEPTTILLLGFGLIGILGLTRKFGKR